MNARELEACKQAIQADKLRQGGHLPAFRSVLSNPADVWTDKGERMYQDIKEGYLHSGESLKRSEEIAARTVWARARSGTEGLISKGYKYGPNPDLSGDIIDGMATALWASAYATWGTANGETPGDGGDWVEFSQPVPDAVEEDAKALAASIARENNVEDISDLLYMAAGAEGLDAGEIRPEHAADFGHYLAMMSLGEGVSWFDDHALFPVELPAIEAWTDDGTEMETSGIARPNDSEGS